MRSSGLPFEPEASRLKKGFDMQKDAGGGGVTITGSNVSTAGGDIVGRDKIQQVSSHQIDNVFDPVCKAIEVVGPSEKAAAEEKLRALKDEAGKGKHADDSVVAKLVEGLVGLVPGAVAGIVGAFASPVLSGLAGPVTKYVLDKIQGK
jgi:hypothetical protein